ncbi:MAG: lysostaphin resistance A-like protein [Microcoleaceae cyanobacterium]
MTLRRLILLFLTLVAIAVVGSSLIASWTQPQIQSRLELYQTNLVLHAAEWQGSSTDQANSANFKTLQTGLLGQDAVASALKQYEAAQESVRASLDKAQRLSASEGSAEDSAGVEVVTSSQSIDQLQQISRDLSIQIGLIQAHQGEVDPALNTWDQLTQTTQPDLTTSTLDIVNPETATSDTAKVTAKVLIGLWSDPVRILPDAESIIRTHLDGWFQYQALSRLYTLQQRRDAVESLNAKEQAIAQESLLKLGIVSAIPGLGLVVGIVLLIFLGAQWFFKRQDALIAQNADVAWTTPWTAETILQVFVVGFFFLGQVVIPILFQVGLQRLNLQPGNLAARSQAELILVNYGVLALGGLLVLYFSIKPFFPLPEDWFRVNWKGNWLAWGLGGYAVALPLVILVSLINQQLWKGQGGSNPILPIALENQDQVALILFFITASIAAPVFEELMFRGFLLPSLTRYVPVSGAIALSSLVFALAHLNVSEVMPLMTLGIVLGTVYTRSRNLLSSMLLHSLWNSGTLLSLYILGSGAS